MAKRVADETTRPRWRVAAVRFWRGITGAQPLGGIIIYRQDEGYGHTPEV